MIITRGGADGQRASLTVCPGGHTGGIGSLGDVRKVCPGDNMLSRLIGSVSRVA